MNVNKFRPAALAALGLIAAIPGVTSVVAQEIAATSAQSLVTPVPALTAAAQLTPLSGTTPAADLTRAAQMYADRNYVGAVDQLNSLLGSRTSTLAPADLETARLYLALATLGITGQRQQGESLVRDFLSRYPASAHRTRALMALAGAQFDDARYAEALRTYRALDSVTLDAATRDARDYYMAYCLLKVAEYDRAATIYDRLGRTGAYAPAARFYRAYIEYCRKDYDNALRLFDDVNTAQAPGDMTDYYRAQIHYMRRNWDKAYSTATALTSSHRQATGADAHYLTEARRIAGEAAYNLNRPDKAMPLLDGYVREAGDSALPSARYALGVCLYDRGESVKAMEQFSAVATQDNAMGQSASLYMGHCYLRLDNYDAATMSFERAMRLDFDSDITETAFYNYAVARSRGGRVPFGSSVSVFEDFLTRFPDSRYDTEVRSYLAYGYMADENYAAALRSIERISDKTPDLRRAHQQILYNLGARRLTAGDLTAAAQHLSDAATMTGSGTDAATALQATLWLADCRYRQASYADAARLYGQFIDRARRDTPNVTAARYGLGYALFDNHRYAEAADAFRRYIAEAAATAPATTVADAECRLGDIAFHGSDFATAGRHYAAAMQRDPAGGDYPLYQQAIILGYHSDYKGKIDKLNELLTRYPNSARIPSALLEMAESYRLAGDAATALTTYDRLITSYSGMPQGRKGMLLAAQLRLNRDERDAAVGLYKSLIRDYPTSSEARTAADALKDICAADGNLDSYVEFIRSVPNGPGIEPDEIDRLTYEAAERHYLATGDISRMSRYLEQLPGGVHRAGALLYEARAALKAGDDDTALNRATAVAVGFADSPEAPEALLIKGTVEARRGLDEDAMNTLETLAAKAPDAATLDAARVAIMRAALRLNRLDRVVDAATQLEGSSNLTPADRLEVDYTHALALCRLGRYDAAATLWERAAADTDELYGAMSACRLGQMYLDNKRLDDAMRVANALVDSNTPHEYWLARGFILLSDVLRARGKTFEADEYLRSLRDNYPGTEADIFADIDRRLGSK